MCLYVLYAVCEYPLHVKQHVLTRDNRPAEKDASNWRAANAITSFSETVPTEEKNGLAQTICYACLVILSNPTTASNRTEKELLPLPDAVLRRAKMREEIGDFLLDEDA